MSVLSHRIHPVAHLTFFVCLLFRIVPCQGEESLDESNSWALSVFPRSPLILSRIIARMTSSVASNSCETSCGSNSFCPTAKR